MFSADSTHLAIYGAIGHIMNHESRGILNGQEMWYQVSEISFYLVQKVFFVIPILLFHMHTLFLEKEPNMDILSV